jgi:hypothetical protein
MPVFCMCSTAPVVLCFPDVEFFILWFQETLGGSRLEPRWSWHVLRGSVQSLKADIEMAPPRPRPPPFKSFPIQHWVVLTRALGLCSVDYEQHPKINHPTTRVATYRSKNTGLSNWNVPRFVYDNFIRCWTHISVWLRRPRKNGVLLRWLWLACADNRTCWMDDVMMRSCSVLRSGSLLRMCVGDKEDGPYIGETAKNGSWGRLNTGRLQQTKSWKQVSSGHPGLNC